MLTLFKISIVIPLYNRDNLIIETLNSVLVQTYDNWECIVVDDGSTDNSYEIVQNIAQSENRIKIYRRDREPKGASTCRNIGVSMATGDFIMFFDSDDILEKHCLEYRIKQVYKYPNFDAWIFPTAIFNKEISDANLLWNRLIKDRDDLLRFLDMDMPWHTSGPLWRNRKDVCWFNEDAASAQDWEMHINQIISGIKYIKIDEGGMKSVHTYYRKSDDNVCIGTNYYGKQKLKNRSYVISTVIANIYGKKNMYEELSEAVNRLIVFYCIKLMENGLKFEARMLWKLYRPTFAKYRIHKTVLWWYFVSKGNFRFLARIIEFIVYRIIKKGNLFERKDVTFSSVMIKECCC